MHLYQKLVGLHIGGNGAGSHMGLKSQNRIPHIVIMRHLYLVKENHILKLRRVAYHCSLSHQGISPDKGTVADLRILSDDGGACNKRRGSHLCGTGNPDILSPLLILLLT